jgi:hypothetical protein
MLISVVVDQAGLSIQLPMLLLDSGFGWSLDIAWDLDMLALC